MAKHKHNWLHLLMVFFIILFTVTLFRMFWDFIGNNATNILIISGVVIAIFFAMGMYNPLKHLNSVWDKFKR